MASTLALKAYFNQKGSSSTLNNFLFLTCTGANLGVQLWASFVSGNSLPIRLKQKAILFKILLPIKINKV
jgi:hypothetical protein